MSSPRAAISVATITSYLPLLKPSSASIRSRCVRFECKTATEWFPCFNLCAMRSAPCSSRKNEGTVKIGPFEQHHEQIKFLFGRHRINGMRNGFGRGTAHTDFHQLGLAQHPGGQPLDLGRQGCRKKQRLPVT